MWKLELEVYLRPSVKIQFNFTDFRENYTDIVYIWLFWHFADRASQYIYLSN